MKNLEHEEQSSKIEKTQIQQKLRNLLL